MGKKKFRQSIKALRLVGGGEYDSHEFTEFCKQHGIQHQFTTRNTQQRNGVIEQKKKPMMDMSRSMISYKKLSNDY